MSPTPSLRWDLPIYTVPDERNPVPVRCEVVQSPDEDGDRVVKILGDWFSCANLGNQVWVFDSSGDAGTREDFLPRLQNLPSKETA
jgi:hypothetical protein